MQLMCDAITVLGSRHGILFNPAGRCCQLIRFDSFPRMPSFALQAGAVINGQEYRFPLCSDGQRFDFFDQRFEEHETLIGILEQRKVFFQARELGGRELKLEMGGFAWLHRDEPGGGQRPAGVH